MLQSHLVKKAGFIILASCLVALGLTTGTRMPSFNSPYSSSANNNGAVLWTNTNQTITSPSESYMRDKSRDIMPFVKEPMDENTNFFQVDINECMSFTDDSDNRWPAIDFEYNVDQQILEFGVELNEETSVGVWSNLESNGKQDLEWFATSQDIFLDTPDFVFNGDVFASSSGIDEECNWCQENDSKSDKLLKENTFDLHENTFSQVRDCPIFQPKARDPPLIIDTESRIKDRVPSELNKELLRHSSNLRNPIDTSSRKSAKKSKLELAVSRLKKNTFPKKAKAPLLRTVKSPPTPSKQYICYDSAPFFKKDSAFTEMLSSKMSYNIQKSLSARLTFMTEGSPGIMVTGVGLLVSHSVKLENWEFPQTIKKNYPGKLIEILDKSRINHVYNGLARRVTGDVVKKLETFSLYDGISVIWIQFLEDGNIVYANQLGALYQIYILDNGQLFKLVTGNYRTRIHKVSSANKFIIMISSFATEMIGIASEFKGSSTKKLYELLWSRVNKDREPELVIIKIKKDVKSGQQKSQPALKHVEKTDEEGDVIEVNNESVEGAKLEYFPFKLMTDIILLEPHLFRHSTFFAKKSDGFVDMILSKMNYTEEKSTKKIIFIKRKSPGIMMTGLGLLISPLVKHNRWSFSEDFKKTCSKKLITKLNKYKLTDTCVSLSTKIQKGFERKFETLSHDNKVSIIWVQLVKNGSIAYTNQLKELYQLYILDNGNLTNLAGIKARAEIYRPSLGGDKFIIMISSFAAKMVKVAEGFKGNNTAQLYQLLWNSVKQGQSQTPELIIIKMKNDPENRPQQRRPLSTMNDLEKTGKKNSTIEIDSKSTETNRLGCVPPKLTTDAIPTESHTYRRPEFFKKEGSGFVDMAFSKMGYEEERETPKRLTFLKRESPGIMVAQMGLLVSPLVKKDRWNISETFEKNFSKEVIKTLNKTKLADTCTLLSTKMSIAFDNKLNTLSRKSKIPIIWVQFFGNGNIAYANQLEELYQLYILDNGNLTNLAESKVKAQSYRLSLVGDMFIIMISSFAAEMVKAASEFRGSGTRELYELIWSRVEQGQEPKPALMVIKIANDSIP